MRIAIAFVLALALAAPAQAATKWKRLTNLSGPAVAAGDGLVVAQQGKHGVAVLGPKGVARRFSFGPQCLYAGVAGGGRAFADCGPVRAMNLTTGDTTDYPSLQEPTVGDGPADVSFELIEAGDRWLRYREESYHVNLTHFRTLDGSQTTDLDDGTVYADLNTPQLGVPLCAPVQRPRIPVTGYEAGNTFYTVTVSGQTAVWARASGLYAWRCGKPKPEHLAAARIYSASGDRVAWAAKQSVVVKNLRTGKRTRLPGVEQPTALALGAKRTLYVTLQDGTIAVTRLP